ncbi:uncharacterized protein LACBIDRAFT_299774 [Laccaria bicolor S238N-H82]|uniref:Predicted protein n=1 Tax=Laccaria bicolor (strain S238N-H82 / ATCC MYA-4686) TaxID=486041 RepID=B0DFE5_LACBS|nr:uncharacterized protein LACBIDRAFT_299774 [Laccaria bicolor S238N-H82]EDR06850.1 predicted protein [Laccaria bicolor S238N-H82]|eukprot:XP_001882697.1 predicted protein [Laccaria bicolor S238N-H82]
MMTLTSTHCILWQNLFTKAQQIRQLQKPICGTMQPEDPGRPMTHAKYVMGSKYWRV